jgi:putative nucleotidyltransferase with HDIG domain
VSTYTLDDVVRQVEWLPRLPDTALRLASLIADPASTVQEIVETIRYDQTVTAELLRICNSAFSGLVRRVNSIDDAVLLLGTAKVLQLAMSAHVRGALIRPQPGYGLEPGALWEHSVAVAVGACYLGQRSGIREPGLLFTMGLLHDLGKVVLNDCVSTEYLRIVQRVNEERVAFHEAEQEILGFTHAEVGARLAESWNLPDPVVRCIRYHHDPQELATPDLFVDAAYLADMTCLLMGVGGGTTDGLAYRIHPTILERHKLTQRDLENVGADIVVEVKAVRELFSASP